MVTITKTSVLEHLDKLSNQLQQVRDGIYKLNLIGKSRNELRDALTHKIEIRRCIRENEKWTEEYLKTESKANLSKESADAWNQCKATSDRMLSLISRDPLRGVSEDVISNDIKTSNEIELAAREVLALAASLSLKIQTLGIVDHWPDDSDGKEEEEEEEKQDIIESSASAPATVAAIDMEQDEVKSTPVAQKFDAFARDEQRRVVPETPSASELVGVVTPEKEKEANLSKLKRRIDFSSEEEAAKFRQIEQIENRGILIKDLITLIREAFPLGGTYYRSSRFHMSNLSATMRKKIQEASVHRTTTILMASLMRTATGFIDFLESVSPDQTVYCPWFFCERPFAPTYINKFVQGVNIMRAGLLLIPSDLSCFSLDDSIGFAECYLARDLAITLVSPPDNDFSLKEFMISSRLADHCLRLIAHPIESLDVRAVITGFPDLKGYLPDTSRNLIQEDIVRFASYNLEKELRRAPFTCIFNWGIVRALEMAAPNSFGNSELKRFRSIVLARLADGITQDSYALKWDDDLNNFIVS